MWISYGSYADNVNTELIWNNDENTVVLSNNVVMPVIGFGTAGLQKPQKRILYAYSVAYRLFDTASDTGPWYRTERVIGDEIVSRSNRKKLFIVTKLHPQDHGKNNAAKSIEQSLKNLKTDYIDLYLIHYPECSPDLCSLGQEGNWEDSWKVMEKYYKRGKIRALGVSNFNQEQLQRLLKIASIKPHVVQTWYDPLHKPNSLVEFCKQNVIQFVAYSAFGTQWRTDIRNPILSHYELGIIAKKHQRSVSQIVIRWLLYHKIATIPRSNNDEHILQNFLVDFELTAEEIETINKLSDKS